MIRLLRPQRRTHPLMKLLWAVGTTVATAYVGGLVRQKMSVHHARKATSARLDKALEDTMDCSDPVASY